MRAILALLAMAGTLAADAVFLKDGRRFGGQVVDKGAHYEVTTESGLQTFLKEEVEKVVTSPAELLGDADRLLEEAKQEYMEALAIADPAAQNAKLKEAIAKVGKAREAFTSTRELFWEEKYAELDQKLLQLLQLTRLLRERVHLDDSRRPDAPAPKEQRPPPPPPVAGLVDALEVLKDPAKRADPSRRLAARDALAAGKATFAGGEDLAAAAALYLSRSDAEWKLEGAALTALQDYLGKYWKEPRTLDGAIHLEAALALSGRVSALNGAAPAEVLSLFAMGHLGHATPGDGAGKVAVALKLVAKDGLIGTAEGHAARDLNRWIATANYDLAPIAYMRECRGTAADTPLVRFLYSYAALRHAQARRRGFERAAAGFEAVKPPEAPFRDHAAAMAKSVRNVGVCGRCAGEGKVRCTNCHGMKESRDDCPKCNGVGAVGGAGPAGLVKCAACNGRGYLKRVKCLKCKDGFPKCSRCDGRQRPAPEMEDLCLETSCAACDGRGLAFAKVLWPCRSCMGLGMRLTPRADPSKILPP